MYASNLNNFPHATAQSELDYGRTHASMYEGKDYFQDPFVLK